VTTLLVVAVCGLLLLTVGRAYSRILARNFGESPGRPTPALLRNDGRDYVPTPTPIVFGHHFASIAGAGPILGPVLAMCYGWGPAVLWVVLGGLFVGGVHDYIAAYMSVREGGQSMATIARRLLGRGPFLAMMFFLVLMLGLVTAAFLNTSATALVSMLDMGRMRLAADQTLFRVVEVAGQQKVIIGGIASTSVIVITALAPLIGWMYLKKQVAVWKCSLVAIALCAASIYLGLRMPVAFPETFTVAGIQVKGTDAWKVLLGIYTLVAAGAPVWMFLQSRDFVNVHILYGGIAALFVTVLVAGLRAPAGAAGDSLPVFDAQAGYAHLGLFWPALFITIACGAVSGFHSLCAGGTTSKQLKTEAATRHIGYWAMILESFLALGVIAVMMIGTTRLHYLDDVFPVGRSENPVLGFAAATGAAGHLAFGLPVAAGALAAMIMLEGFVITTLDTAIRLNRYLIEEIWQELFGRFDVYAGTRAAYWTQQDAAASPAPVPAGSGGIPDYVNIAAVPALRPTPTSGVLRWMLLFLQQYWVNSALAVGLMIFLAMSGGILQLWKIFATSNQVLAAFVLSLGTVWLLRQGRRVRYLLAPGIFMLLTTSASLILLAVQYLPAAAGRGNATLFAADLVLMILTAYLVFAGTRQAFSMTRLPRWASVSSAGQ